MANARGDARVVTFRRSVGSGTEHSKARIARRIGGGALRRLVGRYGLELVREGSRSSADDVPAPSPEPPPTFPPAGFEAIPCGCTERFETDEYDVLPKGRYDVVPRNYYSPVPDLSLLPPDIFERRSALGGVDLRLERAMQMVEQELAPFIAEFDMPVDGPRPPGEFFLNNTNYEGGDAELLYSMVRAKKPARVVELGSGFTTLLISEAARRNAGDGVIAEHVAYDPYPRAQIIGDGPPAPTRFEPVSATDVPVDVFRALKAGDVLFVDTTHTVKLGSDVNFVILDVLPVLAPGVIVHFHDVFLPFEYPRVWFEEMDYLWAEQYLLQAFLAFNSDFEVLLPAQALMREHPERLTAAIPSLASGRSPGAIWLIRR
jgi:hypothetical protein